MEKKWRNGITTGTCSAAAAKAATLAIMGICSETVEVITPKKIRLAVPVIGVETITANKGKACVIKDAGDDPDITNGVDIWAEVELTDSAEIVIQAGIGVGTVTQPGLSAAVGQPAVNPGPRWMIEQALKEVLSPGKGAIVTLSVPKGVELAKRTLNPLLGIENGISIIGTTGIVEPMSEEAFKNSLVPQISVAQALGYTTAVFVPGKIGWNIAVKSGLPEKAVIQTSNFVGFMLEKAAELSVDSILLFGHLGKIVKVAAGIFYTHSRIADARLETLAANAAWMGASQEAVREIMDCKTTEAAMPIIDRIGLASLGYYDLLAGKASERAVRFVFGKLKVGTVIVTMQGNILGMDESAKQIGGALGWRI